MINCALLCCLREQHVVMFEVDSGEAWPLHLVLSQCRPVPLTLPSQFTRGNLDFSQSWVDSRLHFVA